MLWIKAYGQTGAITLTWKNVINNNNMNLIVLQLNIWSLLVYQDDLKDLLFHLDKRNSPVDILLLCETFLTGRTHKLINIPGYTLLSNNREKTKGGGTAILIKNHISYTRRSDLEEFQEGQLESTYIEIQSKNKKKIIVGSLYQPPNISADQLHHHLSETIPKVKSEDRDKQLIFGMDHNLDLLKSNNHSATQKFLDMLIDNGLLPTITWPTRITQQSATLIDNIFISEVLQRNFDSAILIHDMSDHLPTLALMKQTKMTDKNPIEFQSRLLNSECINNINRKLWDIDWIGYLNNKSCDTNFNMFCNLLHRTMDTVALLKSVCISAKRKFSEPWLTQGIERSNRTIEQLYKETLKSNCSTESLIKYKQHQNLLNRIK